MTDPKTTAIGTQVRASPYDEHSAPLYLTSSFTFENAEEMRAAFAGESDRCIYRGWREHELGAAVRRGLGYPTFGG